MFALTIIKLHLLYFIGDTAIVKNCNDGTSDPALCNTNLPNVNATSVQLHEILQIIFGILAAVAVLMIAVAGLRMIADANNPQQIAKARNTIIYSAVGLVIAISAELIVTFVASRL
ncbi:MAG: hypothetical protein JWN38_684 [Candidatus Saccharibacteria bacterium]|nr:hypothetical protein [Candidatus Saccharibacteria bacterium]